MKILLAVLGFILGNLLSVVILAVYATTTDTQMGHPLMLGSILGVIFAFIGYNFKYKKD